MPTSTLLVWLPARQQRIGGQQKLNFAAFLALYGRVALRKNNKPLFSLMLLFCVLIKSWVKIVQLRLFERLY